MNVKKDLNSKIKGPKEFDVNSSINYVQGVE